jgi:hypothetical protein
MILPPLVFPGRGETTTRFPVRFREFPWGNLSYKEIEILAGLAGRAPYRMSERERSWG